VGRDDTQAVVAADSRTVRTLTALNSEGFLLERLTQLSTTSPDIGTPTAFARKWKVSIDTVYRLIKSGELEAVKIGQQWRIDLNLEPTALYRAEAEASRASQGLPAGINDESMLRRIAALLRTDSEAASA